MDNKQRKKFSKFLSFVLRHDPSAIGIQLNKSGWVNVTELLQASNSHADSESEKMTLEQLKEVVRLNEKQRFEFSEDGTQIRARQGHSIDVSLGYKPTEPPELLIHGTPATAIKSIRASGLLKQQRHHVHLHESIEVARDAGGRRGKPVLLRIRAKQMHAQGFQFFVTENGVWLTDHVPVGFIDFPG